MNALRRVCRIFAAALLGTVAGCYGRTTFNYADFKELAPTGSAILEETEFNDAERNIVLEKVIARGKEKEQAYTINAGDTVSITVYNHPDLSIGRTLVTTDGNIGLVLIGEIKVAGLTLDQASKALEDALSKYIRNPKVGISPQEIHSETATIVGAVNAPGIYTISNGMRLVDLFAQAGGAASRLYEGITLDAVDYTHSIFIRDGEIVPIDFARAIQQGDPLHNLELYKGDYIYVAAKDNSMVYLIGDVKSPQRRVWNQGMGLLELLAACGWVNETYWPHVIILRGGVSKPKLYKVDLDGILEGRKPNLLLEPGDIVYVPHDDITEYNVFIRKLFPTMQLINMISTPMFWYSRF